MGFVVVGLCARSPVGVEIRDAAYLHRESLTEELGLASCARSFASADAHVAPSDQVVVLRLRDPEAYEFRRTVESSAYPIVVLRGWPEELLA